MKAKYDDRLHKNIQALGVARDAQRTKTPDIGECYLFLNRILLECAEIMSPRAFQRAIDIAAKDQNGYDPERQLAEGLSQSSAPQEGA